MLCKRHQVTYGFLCIIITIITGIAIPVAIAFMEEFKEAVQLFVVDIKIKTFIKFFSFP
jgi:hypothetical protein